MPGRLVAAQRNDFRPDFLDQLPAVGPGRRATSTTIVGLLITLFDPNTRAQSLGKLASHKNDRSTADGNAIEIAKHGYRLWHGFRFPALVQMLDHHQSGRGQMRGFGKDVIIPGGEVDGDSART